MELLIELLRARRRERRMELTTDQPTGRWWGWRMAHATVWQMAWQTVRATVRQMELPTVLLTL